MTWFKVDDGFYSHPKVLRLRAEYPRIYFQCIGLWTMAGTWSAQQRTDGVVTLTSLRSVGWTMRSRQLLDALVTVGLWVRDGDAIVFSNWADWQPTNEQRERQRAETTERKRRSRSKPPDDVTRDIKTASHPSRPVPSRPDPSRPERERDARANQSTKGRLIAGYARRFESATGELWQQAGYAMKHIESVARWLDANDKDPDQWLDRVFAHEPWRKHRWPWKFVAEDPGKVEGAPGVKGLTFEDLAKRRAAGGSPRRASSA